MKETNQLHKSLKALLFLQMFFVFGCSMNNEKTIPLKVLIPGEWKFHGHLGNYIDTIATHRILDKASWDIIYPETEDAFGLKEDDKNYPKSGQWRGEFWGKYMLSVIAAAKYYKSDELKRRIAKAVDGLLSHQEKNGYLGTYVHSDFVVGNNWNVWSRKYTLWGLLEAYELLNDPKILDAAKNFTDQLMTEVGPGKTDIITTGNFYGMPSTSILFPIVKLYNATGEKKYLVYAKYIVGQWSQHPDGLPDILNKGLSGKPVNTWFPETDSYKWAKGYEFTSCVEGLVELYKITHNENYMTAAENIHKALVGHERTPVGSISFNDKIVGSAGLINTVSEVCDVVYWNRLSYALFTLTGDSKYVDEMERSLYNSLLCAFNRDGNWGLRRIRTSHVHIPATNHFLLHHQCCTDNLPRGLFQAADFALMKRNGDEVYLSLFNEGEGSVEVNGEKVGLKIKGDFIDESQVQVSVALRQPLRFRLFVRIPPWSRKTLVTINSREFSGKKSKGWIAVDRDWNDGDLIGISFDMQLRWETFDPSLFDSTYHDIGFYNKTWAAIKYVRSTNPVLNEKYDHPFPLTADDALPQQKALMFFYGPLALSRDVRISKKDIFTPLIEPTGRDSATVRIIKAPDNIWKGFELNLGNGQNIRFCDFSSAGNTWDKNSLFNTWCIVKK